MKIGSVVECINNSNIDEGVVILKLNYPYTVRGFQEDEGSGAGVYLEEVINHIADSPYKRIEWAYRIERFRELQPPMEIQSALDECEPILIEK